MLQNMRFSAIFLVFALSLAGPPLLVPSTAEAAEPIVINELMASNSGCIQDSQDQYDDWVEIYNYASYPVHIGGMYLTDDLSEPTKWRIPTATTVPAGGYLLIWADNDVGDSELHANFKLDADGEEIGLYESDGITLIDSITFGKQTTDISYGRFPNASDELYFFSIPSPGAQNEAGYLGVVADTKFSVDRGFYDTPFSVTITTETVGAVIRYTTDGSAPIETSGRIYTGPVQISTTTSLRAMAYKQGWLSTNVDTHTYIFLDDVIQQPQYPPGFPTNGWGHAGPDYEMDPVVVNAYSRTIKDDLKSIPTISLVMNTDDWFGSKGIYINESQDGTERVVSMEYIDPNDSGRFQINCAISMQGGVSGGGTSLDRWKSDKLSMRPRFKTTTDDGTPTGGPTKLNYKILRDSPVENFDTLVLDARLNNAWNYGNNDTQRRRAQYTRDQFTSDIQNAMGGYGHHGLHVHLYLNGLYWGLYNLHERPDESFAASHLGGNKDDYDVLKHDENTVVNGSNTNYREMFDVAGDGLSLDSQYQLIQQYLDIPNFIDYTITNFYIGNSDWAHKNWYASRNLADPDGLWRYHCWDAEHVMEGLYDNTPQNGRRPNGSPLYLHDKLIRNDEYRMLFADHVHRHFFNDGVLTVDNAAALYQYRLDEVDRAVVGESARWGDNRIDQGGIKYTRDEHWVNQRDWLLNTYFPRRTGVVLNQLKSEGWYPNIESPEFRINSSYQHGGWAAANSMLSITSGSGTIFYTLDGFDPRYYGGSIDISHARVYYGQFALTESVHIKARVLSGGTWSALNEATYAIGPVADNLRITEVMYHPQNDPNEEFAELTNIGAEAINLNLVKFTNGIDFTFPSLELAPGEYIVIVQDRNAFENRYGTEVNVAGQYSGRLNNAGEKIELEDAIGQKILEFDYKDGWYPTTDGDGFSLTIIDPANHDPDSWNNKDYWRASTNIGGSPGRDDNSQ